MTRVEPCSWGCGKQVTLTWRRYPPSSGVTGFFWDAGEHTCGVVRRAKFDAYVPAGYDLGVPKEKLPSKNNPG